MSLEELIRAYQELAHNIAKLEDQKKELSRTILREMPGKMLSVAGYIVRRYDRFSVKIPIEEARKLNATKMEEVIDRDKLKKIYQSNQAIPGASLTSFIQVSLQKKSDPAQLNEEPHIHDNPHEHPSETNPTGGTPKGGDPKPLENWKY
jgi:hypothetical protein